MDTLPREILLNILRLLSPDVDRYVLVCRLWAEIITPRKTVQIQHCDAYSLMLCTYSYDKLYIASKGQIRFYYYYDNNADVILDEPNMISASCCKWITTKFILLPLYVIQIILVDTTVITLYARHDKVKYGMISNEPYAIAHKSMYGISILSYLQTLIDRIYTETDPPYHPVIVDFEITHKIQEILDNHDANLVWCYFLRTDKVVDYIRSLDQC